MDSHAHQDSWDLITRIIRLLAPPIQGRGKIAIQDILLGLWSLKISEPLLVGGFCQARDWICFEPWVWRARHDQQGLWGETGNRRLLALERLKDRGRRCRARRSRARSWSIGGLLTFQGCKLGFEVQDALLASRIGQSEQEAKIA